MIMKGKPVSFSLITLTTLLARASNTPSLVRIMLVSLADVVTEILCITALSKDFVFSHIQVNINNLDDNILSIMHTILALMQTLVTLHIYRKFGSLDTSNAIRGTRDSSCSSFSSNENELNYRSLPNNKHSSPSNEY